MTIKLWMSIGENSSIVGLSEGSRWTRQPLSVGNGIDPLLVAAEMFKANYFEAQFLPRAVDGISA